MEGWVQMSRKEFEEYEIVKSFIEGKLTRKEASLRLGLSERALTNRANKVRKKGSAGAFHGNKGRIPRIKKSEHSKARYKARKKEIYFDFNVKHAWELIREEAGSTEIETVSYTTFYNWCRESNLLKHKQRRRKNSKMLRDRKPLEGQMLQLDGSHHHWINGTKWTLIYAIDDATSDIPAGEFFDSETTIGCLKVLERIITTKGVPESFYVDKAGWGAGPKRVNFSQFDEACKQLDIRLIYANSPEAKGRVERGNRTHQDRLPPLFRHLKINSKKEATRYFNKEYKAYWQNTNTVESTLTGSCYRPAPEAQKLKEILCIKQTREARNDGAISFGNVIYKVKTKQEQSPYKGTPVEIRQYLDGTWSAFVHDERAILSLAPSNRQSTHRYLEQIPNGNLEIDKEIENIKRSLFKRSA